MAQLEVSALTKTYKDKIAVHDVSFSIEEGRCVALLGPNGAGKTTTLNMLSGLLKPDSGHIRFHGLGDNDDLRAHIGYMPQSMAFYGWMTGREYLVYVARLARLSRREASLRADRLLEQMGIAEARDRRIASYSGGMKQRLGLAQAMIHQPKLLLLDEPVSALDPIGRREVLELLKQIKHEMTVLFSTHVLHDAEEVCDDLLIIRDGQIVITGALDEVRKQYEQPMIELEIVELDKQPLSNWLEQWRGWGLQPEVTGSKVKLMVSRAGELEAVRQKLLQQLSDENVPLIRLNIGQTTLEDLFMKVVLS